jgi:hypothetical protein
MNLEKVNSEYFNAYGDLAVHELMLKDQPRNKAYLQAIEGNRSYFQVE